jgi:uncharacterized protein (DUF2147 family)
MRRVGFLVALATLCWNPPLSAQPHDIRGVWWTDKNEARIEIKNCTPPQQGLCGTIIWLQEPNDARGSPLVDKANPNPSLRSRSMIGLPLFQGWREDGPGRWKGAIYDPDDGKTYDISIASSGDRLMLKGCVLLFCDTSHWTRYRGR